MELDSLELKIQTSAGEASSGINKLAAALLNLKNVSKGGAGLTVVANQLSKLTTALSGINVDSGKLGQLANALNSLSNVQKASGLSSTVNALNKIPNITKQLNSSELNKFAIQMKAVANAVRPLATEMQKVSNGFAAFPIRIQKIISSSNGLNASLNKTTKSFNLLDNAYVKLTAGFLAARQIGSILSGWITESNAYVENLNLFTVSMGEYAKEAQAYAEQVGEIMGIDPSTWMRNQGVFMTLATGFGVAADRAEIMSKNLTQLGYDLSSFFNISVEDAMQKLQSGLSGELEPLRRLGFDLSQARLEAIALSLGIDQSVASMTQAEKSELRFYAMLTQVTKAQGDMARTLQAPANQLRILQAQATQAGKALGNIFIPALNAVLPYAIAFLKVVRTVAQEIANLFGFELPEVDYSGISTGVENVSSGFDDIADSAGNASGAAKKLKMQLAGFDEINLIATETGGSSGGGGVGGGSAGGSGLDFELPQYDFLGDAVENRANEIADAIMPVFKDVLEIALQIGAAIALWKISSKFFKTLGNVIDYFKKGRKELTALEKIQRAIQGAIVLTLGLKISYDAGFEIGKGTAGIMDYIKAVLGPVAAGIGGAMIAGPAGFVIGLTLGVLFELKGIIDGREAAMVVDNFTASITRGKISITDYAASATAAFNEISLASSTVAGIGEKMATQTQTIESAKLSLDTYMGTWQTTGTASVEEINKIISTMDSLLNATQEKMSLSADALKTTLVQAMKDATDESYNTYEGMLNLVYLLESEGNSTIAGWKAELAEAELELSRLDGTSSTFAQDSAALNNRINELRIKISGIGTATSDVTDELRNFNAYVGEIDFSNLLEYPDQATSAIVELQTATTSAYNSIREAYQTNMDAIDTIISTIDTESPGWKEAIESELGINAEDIPDNTEEIKKYLQTQFTNIYGEQLSAIESLYDDSYGTIVASIEKVIEDVTAETGNGKYALDKDYWSNQLYGKDYESLLASGDEGAVQALNTRLDNMWSEAVAQTVSTLKEDEKFKPMFDALESAFSETELSRTKAISAGKAFGLNLGASVVEGQVEGMTNATAQGFLKAGSENMANLIDRYGKIAYGMHSPADLTVPHGEGLTAGTGKGMVDKNAVKSIDASTKDLSKIITDNIEKNLDLKSAGSNIVDNLSEGIKGNSSAVNESISSLTNNMESTLKSSSSDMRTIGVDMTKQIASGLNTGSGNVRNSANQITAIIRNSMSEAKTAVQQLVASVRESFADFSTTLSQQGGNAVKSYAQGITKNTGQVNSAFKGMLNGLLGLMETFINRSLSALNGMMAAYAAVMTSVIISAKLGRVTYSAAETIKIPKFAAGAYDIPQGQLFIAREDGPEMVGTMSGRTSVANNEQIIEGISRGVAGANEEQNALLREQNALLRQLLAKEGNVIFPTSPEAGRAVYQSLNMYNTVRGVT